ncbi:MULTISPECIES: hypothetical protein [Streptomyces]|uniref:Uncharacterized protein n=2 Tax=Streptomyces rimosus subsp. rimosus TaxID=132474 RepID=L8EZ78_STRR1|nr:MULTISPECIES: hypothetical protein [Streptomyces]KOG70510.1 hypothetical protein ADK78_28375 [Kitasatospora aureofaciens]MYT47284.1 hypothetical protein [Streptomyces sp. SID5471]KEF04617.1 hypothetical protein DF17_22255 [Streptomyces rimosus]KEF19961.1 hypothetical protein DF18_14115 [Streptomyces rimosus]KOT31341.1 hypothetical protein ADK84_29890 [Streptomyces sp. NRRL WC-3701]
MTRIQILELPTFYRESGDDETPFVVIIDQAGPSLISVDEASRLHLAEKIGARAVLVFEDSIEIPGSRIAVPGDGQAPSGTAEM